MLEVWNAEIVEPRPINMQYLMSCSVGLPICSTVLRMGFNQNSLISRLIGIYLYLHNLSNNHCTIIYISSCEIGTSQYIGTVYNEEIVIHIWVSIVFKQINKLLTWDQVYHAIKIYA